MFGMILLCLGDKSLPPVLRKMYASYEKRSGVPHFLPCSFTHKLAGQSFVGGIVKGDTFIADILRGYLDKDATLEVNGTCDQAQLSPPVARILSCYWMLATGGHSTSWPLL